ncbi:MAG: cytochrome c biogenesis protein CcdA [Candidatus Mycalebacterium zealandia]|nr:MAG: cytochrome c biogenesis protein CcdA [Candidatus Mycalebacterium zealandia]
MTGASPLEPAFALAFLSGIASFLSPCIFPLVPGYLSALTMRNGETEMPSGKFSLLGPTILFVAGFAFVFSLMGTSASFLGSFLSENRTVLATVSGALIMILGLITMDIVKIPALRRERTLRLQTQRGGPVYVFVLGCAFAFGWVPCIGPMLAAILSYASSYQDPARGFALLLAYSCGLGVPFVAAGLLFSRWRTVSFIGKKYYPVYKYIVGALMVAVGFLIAADFLFYVNVYGQKLFDFLGIDFWTKI